ncbi:prolyl 3-hydroxylase OGFOD1, partial [Hyalella azteca]|uniref:Prolyl 3-hydroxylase OGFOD1 n=1 Tax=Hyalella azteca TaxID=294128 RepID=A0A979FJP5_HYAAZ
ASLYLHTDALLCHDDELEGRRVAFILYLGDLGAGDGGSLDLFDGGEEGDGVAEVRSAHKERLAVGGWYHGPPIQRPPRPLPPSTHRCSPRYVEEEVLRRWVSPVYLAEALQAGVRRQFLRDSEIELQDFLLQEAYEELSAALRGLGAWRWAGPPTSAHYQVVCGNEVLLPAVVHEFLQVMTSEAMFLILSQLTGLSLHHLAPTDDADSDDDESSGNDSDEEPADGCDEEPADGSDEEQADGKVLTLKQILKIHRKQRRQQPGTEGEQVDCDNSDEYSDGLDQPWVYDVGINFDNNNENNPESDRNKDNNGKQKPSEFCSDINRRKKGNKKEKTSKKLGEQELLSNNKGNCSQENKGPNVSCSLRRISHGCYSLIRDDDNNDNSSGDNNSIDNSSGDNNSGDNNCVESKSVDNTYAIANAENTDNKTGKKTKKSSKDQKKNKAGDKREQLGEQEPSPQQESGAPRFVLDAYLHLNLPGSWREAYGGYTAYVASDQREQLVTLVPRTNHLALVYRDSCTFRFLKHLNTGAPGGAFHQVQLQYRES